MLITDAAPMHWTCQLQVPARYPVPGDLQAVDAVTGETLLFLPKGFYLTEQRCINAPNGHPLEVTGPNPGDKAILPGNPGAK